MANVWLVRRGRATHGEVYDRKSDALARGQQLVVRGGGGRLCVLTYEGLVERELDTAPAAPAVEDQASS